MACGKKATRSSKGKQPQTDQQALADQITDLTKGMTQMLYIVLELQRNQLKQHERMIRERAQKDRARE